MAYFSKLLRQSAARVGPVPQRRIHGPAALEVDDVRVVHPRSAPVTRTQTAPTLVPPPVRAEPEHPLAMHKTPPPSGERQADKPEREASATLPQPVVPVVAPAACADAAPQDVPHAAAVIEPRRTSRPDTRPEERALRSVAEVVTWVAAGAQVGSPRGGVATEHAHDVSRQADEPLRTESASVPVDAPPGVEDVSPRDRANVTVSVGTIEVTVEDPAGTVALTQAAPSPVAPPDVIGGSPSRLSRYYLRP
jgi:hypothetical protein